MNNVTKFPRITTIGSLTVWDTGYNRSHRQMVKALNEHNSCLAENFKWHLPSEEVISSILCSGEFEVGKYFMTNAQCEKPSKYSPNKIVVVSLGENGEPKTIVKSDDVRIHVLLIK